MANNPLPLDFILSGALPKLRPRLLSLQTTIILMLHIVHRNSETVSKICKLSPGQNAWEMTVTTSCAFHSEEYILPTNIDTKASLFIHQPGITPTSIYSRTPIYCAPIYRKPRFTAPQNVSPILRNRSTTPVYEHLILC